jgi:hypothetical protein
MSVRLPEGLYEAVGELAKHIGIDKSDVATLLLFYGVASVKGNPFSQKTVELVLADTLESYGSFVRKMAKLPPAARAEVEKQLGELIKKLAQVFPGME